MEDKELSKSHLLNPRLSYDEKLAPVNLEWQRLYDHFKNKAALKQKAFLLL